jgi:hypothetical protein
MIKGSFMKTLSIFFCVLVLSSMNLAFGAEEFDSGSCKVVDQSWSMEPLYCTNHGYPTEQPYRCYAVIETEGHRVKVWGGSCYATSFDCAFGEGKVEACD